MTHSDIILLIRKYYCQFKYDTIDVMLIIDDEAMISINNVYYFINIYGVMLNLDGKFMGLCH